MKAKCFFRLRLSSANGSNVSLAIDEREFYELGSKLHAEQIEKLNRKLRIVWEGEKLEWTLMLVGWEL